MLTTTSKTVLILLLITTIGAGCQGGKQYSTPAYNRTTPIDKDSQEMEEQLGIRPSPPETKTAAPEKLMKPDFNKQLAKNITVTLETNFGNIKIKLFPAEAPKTVNNFIQLAQQKFYNGSMFHRVIKDFMIQGGDPNSKDTDWANDGQGGPGYKFEDEFNKHKVVRGALAMANSGPNTNGSQFFIVTTQAAAWLDGKHTVFGEVVEGMSVVDRIENVDKNANDHPTKDVVINDIKVVESN